MIKIIEISGVFHGRHNPYRFEVDDNGNIISRPKNLPSCLLNWPNVKQNLSDHSRCTGNEMIPCKPKDK